MKFYFLFTILTSIALYVSGQTQPILQAGHMPEVPTKSSFGKGITRYTEITGDTLLEQLHQRQLQYKFMMTGKQAMDSLVTQLYNEYSFELESNYRFSFTFDKQEKQIRFSEHSWNFYLNKWQDYKEEYAYDTDGNMVSKFVSEWNNNVNDWSPVTKDEFSYETNNRLSETIQYVWLNTASEWSPSAKQDYKYDSHGSDTLHCSYLWNVNSHEWVNSAKEERTYDEANHLTSYRYSLWNTETYEWTPFLKTLFEFDSTGNMASYSEYMFILIPESWIGQIREEYQYNANNYRVLEESFSWNLLLNDWNINSKTDYTYLGDGREIAQEYSVWDENGNFWVPASKLVTTYSNDADTITKIDYYWKLAINQWIEINKYQSMYNPSGFELLRTVYLWNSSILEWEPRYKYDFTPDEENNLTEVVSSTWFGSAWFPQYRETNTFNNAFARDGLLIPFQVSYDYSGYDYMMVKSVNSVWRTDLGTWQIVGQKEYYFSPSATSSVPETTFKAIVFPNPANEYFIIRLPANSEFRIELFNSQGQVVLSKFASGEEKISLQKLPPGIYPYRIAVSAKEWPGILIKR